MPSPQQTMEQLRAASAWNAVRSVKGRSHGGKYQSLVQGAPADVMTSGLGQILAFLKAKGDPEHQALTGHLSQWICPQMGWQASDDLLTQLTADTATTDDYRRATAEALAYLVWLKRFAEAELG